MTLAGRATSFRACSVARMMGVRLVPLIIVAGITALPATPGHAAPTIDIKARTQLSLDRVRRRPDGLAEITGHLHDQLTGTGIPRQSVRIAVAGTQSAATTDENGRFTQTLPIPPGPQTFDLSYAGAASLDSSEYSTLTDPSRAQVSLTLAVSDAPGGASVVVSATVDDVPTPMVVDLAVGAPTDATLTPIAKQPTDKPLVITRRAAQGPGTRRVRASFPGDATRQPATAEATFDLTSASHTSIRANTTLLAYEAELVVNGRVIDEDSQPVARSAVTLMAGDRRLAQGGTDKDGRFELEIEGEIIGTGQFALQVLADPSTTFVRPSRSDPLVIQIAKPQPVPVSYTIAAFIATLFAAGGFLIARTRPWLRLHRPARPAEQAAPSNGEPDRLDGGLVIGKPGAFSTLRRAFDDGFAGVVRDTVRGRPVAGALVPVVLGQHEHRVETGGDGGFALEGLAAGEWSARVSAPGHMTETFTVTIPHRGELRGARVDLVPVRERVFQLYRRAAEPTLPESRLWGVWSPRQIVDHVRAKRPSPALAELTDFVEEVYFSSRVAPETIIAATSSRVDEAIRERVR